MLKVDEAIPHIEELLRTCDPGSEVVIWDDGRIEVRPPPRAELPEHMYAPHEHRIIATFLVGEPPPPEQEVRDRLNTGLAAHGEGHH